MIGTIEKKLQTLGIMLPEVAAPVANYLPFVKSGNQIFISGQLPLENGQLKYIGKLGGEISVEDGKKAARACVLNIIANLKNACNGDLDRVSHCVKLGIFVNSTADFADHSLVGNGASDLLVEIFGIKGKHSRFAVGVPSLPKNVAVEIDAIFEIE